MSPVQELVSVGKELFWAQGASGLVVIQGRSQRRRWEGSGDGVREGKVREARNSMETSDASRTAARPGRGQELGSTEDSWRVPAAPEEGSADLVSPDLGLAI